MFEIAKEDIKYLPKIEFEKYAVNIGRQLMFQLSLFTYDIQLYNKKIYIQFTLQKIN